MKINRLILKAILVATAVSILPLAAMATEVTDRSITLGSSAPGAITTHTFGLTVPSTANVGSIEFKYCTTPLGACTTPAGLVTTVASLINQTGATGFSVVNTNNGTPYISRGSASIPATTQVTYQFSGVTNPSGVNVEYWVRVNTYASIDTTGSPIDGGVVDFVTTSDITVSGIMPESLIFCVGTSGTSCANITGSAVSLGIFSPALTNTGTSVMSASTNASFGYTIALAGSTLSSGANTITSMGQQSQNGTASASAVGTSQFGTNLRANSTPPVGANVSGLGTGVVVGGYNVVDNFRYFSGDTLANAGGPVNDNLFTNSYIVNVSPDQAAGVYTATMTYICTATF